MLLSGDHVMQGSTVVIRPPDGDMATYLASLRRLLEPDAGFVTIAPGHGRLIDNPDRGDRRRSWTTASGARSWSPGPWRPPAPAPSRNCWPPSYADVAPVALPVARYSLWAHLLKLAADGRALGPVGGRDRSGRRTGSTPPGGRPPTRRSACRLRSRG